MNFKDAVEYAKLQDMILVPYENERGMEATREALKKVKPGQSISVFIGPEGGFSEEEIDALRQDAEVLSLGKRIDVYKRQVVNLQAMLVPVKYYCLM